MASVGLQPDGPAMPMTETEEAAILELVGPKVAAELRVVRMKIMIALPVYRGFCAETTVSLAAMSAFSAQKGQELQYASASGVPIAIARNGLAQASLEMRADYILFIDDDMVFPNDTLERLLSHKRKVIGVICSSRHNRQQIGEVGEGNPAIASRLGTGVLLVATEIFRRVAPPWFQFQWGTAPKTEDNRQGIYSEDMFFCDKMRDSKIELWADTSLRIGHVGSRIYYLGEA